MNRIWYVAYGSNLSRDRFSYYLRGGRPDGSERDFPGCRDSSDPSDSFGLLISGGVYFAGTMILVGNVDMRLIFPLVVWLAGYIGITVYFVPRLGAMSKAQEARSPMRR